MINVNDRKHQDLLIDNEVQPNKKTGHEFQALKFKYNLKNLSKHSKRANASMHPGRLQRPFLDKKTMGVSLKKGQKEPALQRA